MMSSTEWRFSSTKIAQTDITLERRQKLAKFILDLGTKIPVKTNLCLYTAIAYMQRFFTMQSSKQFHPIRLCQAALFFACKNENHPVTIQEICKKTSELLNLTWDPASNTETILRNRILDYEDTLFSTLGLGFIVQHPYENIESVLAKVQITDREKHSINSSTLRDNLKYIAYFLAKQSILLTTFSLQYSNELIAQFCVQLAIKIYNHASKSTIRLIKSTGEFQQIEQLIREFSIIFINHADTYNKTFHDKKECDLYADIKTVALKHTKPFVDRSISRALNSTNASQCPDIFPINRSPLYVSSSTGVPSPSYHMASPPQSKSDHVETGVFKRRLDCSNDEDVVPFKRLSLFSESK